MKNIVGQIPRDNDFFKRDNLIKKIYRRLDSGANVYLTAPRRVGKSSIMRYLEDYPAKNYSFIYTITESTNDSEAYFRELLRELFRSDAFNKLIKASRKFSELIKKIKSFNVGELGLELKDTGINYFEDFQDLIQKLKLQDTKIVIMVDEFPQTVENILRKSGKESAVNFLQANRDIRQEANKNIQFILTGSIGLSTLAEKLDATKEINDLNIIEIPPLSDKEAINLVNILLDSYQIPREEDVARYLLEKIQWPIPFFVQLAVQEIIDEYENMEQAINIQSVDTAFSRITNIRNNIYFEHYYSRLKKTFTDKEYDFALALLYELAHQKKLVDNQIEQIALKYQLGKEYPIILRTLIFDGYIFDTPTKKEMFYSFTSPLLQIWWNKYVKQTNNKY